MTTAEDRDADVMRTAAMYRGACFVLTEGRDVIAVRGRPLGAIAADCAAVDAIERQLDAEDAALHLHLTEEA